MDYTFEWIDKEGIGHRMNVATTEESTAWYFAFKKCGWEQRTTLGLVGNNKSLQIKNGIVKNWWQAMNDTNLHKFNTLYFSGNLQDRLKSGFLKLVEL